MSTLEFTVIDRLFLVMYGMASPSDDEWGSYLATVERHGIERTMQLIITDGGEPTSEQRRELNELLGSRVVPVAVVSSSARVRGTVTALSWLNRRIKAFPPSELWEALAYLEIPRPRFELVEHELLRLRSRLEGTP